MHVRSFNERMYFCCVDRYDTDSRVVGTRMFYIYISGVTIINQTFLKIAEKLRSTTLVRRRMNFWFDVCPRCPAAARSAATSTLLPLPPPPPPPSLSPRYNGSGEWKEQWKHHHVTRLIVRSRDIRDVYPCEEQRAISRRSLRPAQTIVN